MPRGCKGTVMIGMGERSSHQAITQVAQSMAPPETSVQTLDGESEHVVESSDQAVVQDF